MSDHAWILENLAAYLTGGLEPAERERVEQHIAECPPCAAALADTRAMDTAMSGLFVEARPSAVLEDRVIQTLRKRSSKNSWRLPLPAWLPIAAAALVLIGLTGSMASQFLLHENSASPGAPEFRFSFLAGEDVTARPEATKDVAALAAESRQKTLERLDEASNFSSLTLSDESGLSNGIVRGRVSPNRPSLSTRRATISDGEQFAPPGGLPAQTSAPNSATYSGVAMGEGSVRSMTAPMTAPPPPATANMPAEPLSPAPSVAGERADVSAAKESLKVAEAAVEKHKTDTERWGSEVSRLEGEVKRGIVDSQVLLESQAQLKMSESSLKAAETAARKEKTQLASAQARAASFGIPFQPSKQLGFDSPDAAKDGKAGDIKGQSSSGPDSSGEKHAAGRDLALAETPQKKEQEKEKLALPPPGKSPEQPGPRKIIIRTGEIEYEVQSFDAAVATIARLVKSIKGGFIATVNSDKLANGKVRGSVVVRVPPENLDELILDLRTNLSKGGELKNQRIGSQDITKQYTDLESELKAARAMEERLLQIIKTGKGEIKDLLAAEKELGNWRTRIEKIEGELRYYANQVALSTLTITLYEKEITAPFAVIEREQVQMGIEVEDVDQAYQAAQKAVREAKGRITRAELKQPSQGQFSALLQFEVSPEAAGPLRDRLKQLGTVARFEVSRQEETQGGAGKPSDGKVKRSDTRFHVHFYNLTDVPPRETVVVSVACVDVETAMKTLLARVDKAAGRILSSNLTSTRGAQTQGDLHFQVKTALADAVLEDIKSAGEVMSLQVSETTNMETTRKKRGFQVRLWALEAAAARETDVIQLACTDVAASYRLVQEAVQKAKGRVRNAQLDEQDRRRVTATLDFEVRRADEDGVRAALLKAGAVYTRKVSRAADNGNVVDSKVHWQVAFLNQANIPPRETYVFGVEVADVDQTAAMLTALTGKRDGRTVEANISRDRKGQVIGKLIYDVPMAEVHELLDALKSTGAVRVQQSVKHPEVPDSPLAIARLEVTLSNTELIVPSDDGFGPNVRRGLSDSFAVLSWSLRILILGLCVLLPWALVIWAIYRLVVRLRRRTTPSAPAA
ncbi:MAG TPA: DUF4349 domain-containing protein [Gemmataceae bacterium]|nr:DUF4349 domain-containing protein [Gemmataceae bacterium]